MASKHATKRQTKKRAQARRVKNQKQHQISLCMIVKNEEEFLPGCLESVKGVVDEIIVVDTGSTDRTVEIARQYGAKVYHYEWNDDFAAARNESLKHATCGWILVLDADERLDVSSGAVLRMVARGEVPKAMYACRIVNADDSGKATEHVAPRFFPGGGRVAYRGLVHEQPRPADGDSSLDSMCHLLKGFVVIHVGYQDSVIRGRNKRARNIELLQRTLAQEDNPYHRYKLGATLLEEGYVEQALSELEHALTLLTERRQEKGSRALRAQIRVTLSAAYLKNRRFNDALTCVKDAVEESPESKLVQFQYALCLFHTGEIVEARDCFMKLASGDQENIHSATDALGFDSSICTWKARTMAARCSLRLGDVSGAARSLAGAADFLPRSGEYVRTVRDTVTRLRLQGSLNEHDVQCLKILECVLREEATAQVRMGDEWFGAGRIGEALGAYRNAVQLGHAIDGSILARIASCEARLGNTHQAFTTYLSALRAAPSDARSVELLIELTRLFRERIGKPWQSSPQHQAATS